MKTNQKYLDFLGKVNTKKISLNIEEKSLKIIDDLAELAEANRTVIFLAILEKGIPNFVQFLNQEWKKYEKSEKTDTKKVKEMQEKLSNFRRKWKI